MQSVVIIMHALLHNHDRENRFINNNSDNCFTSFIIKLNN